MNEIFYTNENGRRKKNDYKLTLDEISSSYMEPRVIRKHKIDHDRTRN